MIHVSGNFFRSCSVVSCVALALIAVGCSGADLGAGTTTQGTTSLGTTATGGASSTTGNGSGQTGGTTGTSTKANTGGAGTTATGGGSSASAPTWSKLYTSYFGSGTAGNCVSCHGAGTAPSFNSASTMCTALKQRNYIQNGSSTLDKLLTWFGGNGTMPPSGGAAPANAVNDINSRKAAGSVCP
jgi:mono/diheme cytochrome c family protein